MTRVLFETHHLYYWPNFLPIINELKSRKKYKIEVSMPKRSSDTEENLLIKSCDSLELSFISGKTEQISPHQNMCSHGISWDWSETILLQ